MTYDTLSGMERLYPRILLMSLATLLLIVAIFNYTTDPFWIWHDDPHRAVRGQEMTLHMRLIKALQVVTRQPDVVLLGTSRVYRSMDPSLMKSHTYNMGLSSLTIFEAEKYLRYIHKWTSAKHVILGLDFLSFDSLRTRPGFSDDLFANVMTVLLNKTTTKASLLARLRKADAKDWHPDGYQYTSKVGHKRVNALLTIMQEKVYAPLKYQPESLAAFERLLQFAHDHAIALQVYVSPINYRLLSVIKASGQYEHYRDWKQHVVSLAREYNTELIDMNDNTQIVNKAFESEQDVQQNPYYLDPSHFSPLTATLILKRLEVKINKSGLLS